MRQFIFTILIALFFTQSFGQSLEFIEKQDLFQAGSVQKVRIPLRFKNTSDKAQNYVVRKVNGELTHSLKSYFCQGGTCLEASSNELSVNLEPGEFAQNIYYVVETGIISGFFNFKLELFQKGNPKELIEHSIGISVEEKPKPFIFQSKDISIQDAYPNPTSDQVFVEYKTHNETARIKLLIHNILGRVLGDYQLPSSETKIKIPTEDLPTGVYFYTLYVDQEAVITRKLIVRK